MFESFTVPSESAVRDWFSQQDVALKPDEAASMFFEMDQMSLFLTTVKFNVLWMNVEGSSRREARLQSAESLEAGWWWLEERSIRPNCLLIDSDSELYTDTGPFPGSGLQPGVCDFLGDIAWFHSIFHVCIIHCQYISIIACSFVSICLYIHWYEIRQKEQNRHDRPTYELLPLLCRYHVVVVLNMKGLPLISLPPWTPPWWAEELKWNGRRVKTVCSSYNQPAFFNCIAWCILVQNGLKCSRFSVFLFLC